MRVLLLLVPETVKKKRPRGDNAFELLGQMVRQEKVRGLTIEGVEGYDNTKPRSQSAFGRLLGLTIGGDPGEDNV